MMPPLTLNFVFPSPPPKILSFLAYHQTYLKKMKISDSFTWIVVKFMHQVHNSIPSLFVVGNYEKMSKLTEISFAL